MEVIQKCLDSRENVPFFREKFMNIKDRESQEVICRTLVESLIGNVEITSEVDLFLELSSEILLLDNFSFFNIFSTLLDMEKFDLFLKISLVSAEYFVNECTEDTHESRDFIYKIINSIKASDDEELIFQVLYEYSNSILFNTTIASLWSKDSALLKEFISKIDNILATRNFANQVNIIQKFLLDAIYPDSSNLTNNFLDFFACWMLHTFKLCGVLNSPKSIMFNYDRNHQIIIFKILYTNHVTYPTILTSFLLGIMKDRLFESFTPGTVQEVLSSVKIPGMSDVEVSEEKIASIFSSDIKFGSSIDDNYITSIHHPVSALRFYEDFFVTIKSMNINNCVAYSKTILKDLHSLVKILSVKGEIFEFLRLLLLLIPKLSPWSNFDPIFSIYINVLRITHSVGDMDFQNEILRFILGIEDKYMRFLSCCILNHVDSDDIDSIIKSTIESTMLSVRLLHDPNDPEYKKIANMLIYMTRNKELFENDVKNLINVQEIVQNSPYLSLAPILWCILYSQQSAQYLVDIAIPDDETIRIFYDIMIYPISSRPNPWIHALRIPDFHIKTLTVPHITELKPYILDHFDHFFSLSPFDDKYVVNIILTWTAWIYSYGYKDFFFTLIKVLKSDSILCRTSSTLVKIYKLAGFLLRSSVKAVTPNEIGIIINEFDRNDTFESGVLFSYLTISFLCIRNEINDFAYNFLNFCLRLLKETDRKNNAGVGFAYSYIELLLSIDCNNIIQYINEEFPLYLSKFGFTPTSIYLYKLCEK